MRTEPEIDPKREAIHKQIALLNSMIDYEKSECQRIAGKAQAKIDNININRIPGLESTIKAYLQQLEAL